MADDDGAPAAAAPDPPRRSGFETPQLRDGPSCSQRLCPWTCVGCTNARNEADATRCAICGIAAPRFDQVVRLPGAGAWMCAVRLYVPRERRITAQPARGGEPLLIDCATEAAMTRAGVVEALEGALRAAGRLPEVVASSAATSASSSPAAGGRRRGGKRKPPPGPGKAAHRLHMTRPTALPAAATSASEEPHRRGSLFSTVTEDAERRLAAAGETEEAYDYARTMRMQRETMLKRTQDLKLEEADQAALEAEMREARGETTVAAVHASAAAQVAGLGQRKPCGLCEREFDASNLVGLTYWGAIAEQRRKWGAPFAENDKRVKSLDSLYSQVRLCVFCTQFFDAGFSDVFEFHQCGETSNPDLLRHRLRTFAVQARHRPAKTVDDALSDLQINMLREKRRADRGGGASVRLNSSQLFHAMSKSAPALVGGASIGGDLHGQCNHLGCLCEAYSCVEGGARCIRCGHSGQWHVVVDAAEAEARRRRRARARKLARARQTASLPDLSSPASPAQRQQQRPAWGAPPAVASPVGDGPSGGKKRRKRRRRKRRVRGPPREL